MFTYIHISVFQIQNKDMYFAIPIPKLSVKFGTFKKYVTLGYPFFLINEYCLS